MTKYTKENIRKELQKGGDWLGAARGCGMLSKIKSKFRDFIGKHTYPEDAVKIHGDVYVECYPTLHDYSWTFSYKHSYRCFDQNTFGVWKPIEEYLYTNKDYSKC